MTTLRPSTTVISSGSPESGSRPIRDRPTGVIQQGAANYGNRTHDNPAGGR